MVLEFPSLSIQSLLYNHSQSNSLTKPVLATAFLQMFSPCLAWRVKLKILTIENKVSKVKGHSAEPMFQLFERL